MRIFAFHLLNDYSGSPKVLMQLLKGWNKQELEVHLVTCSGREGFLSKINGITYHFYWYRFATNPFVRLFNFIGSQALLFLTLFVEIKKDDIIYINTVLPFGAALLGKIKGCRIIYHIHETTMKPPVLKKFLFGIVKWAAKDVVYVSNYLSEQEAMPKLRKHILYNTIEDSFLKEARKKLKTPYNSGNVLMVCSLKAYKGVNEFVQLAKDNAHFRFRLVMNASQKDINDYFKNFQMPENLELFDTQTNLHPFYQWADAILNLSRPDGWIETFGLTIIEGMAYGLPAIIPPVGGITEIVDEKFNGFKVDSRNRALLNDRLNNLLGKPGLYAAMAANADKKINTFRENVFMKQSLEILQ